MQRHGHACSLGRLRANGYGRPCDADSCSDGRSDPHRRSTDSSNGDSGTDHGADRYPGADPGTDTDSRSHRHTGRRQR